MTTTSDPIAAPMRAADPLAVRTPVDPGLVADLEAAWNRIAAAPAPRPRRRRRRVVLLAVAAAAVVAAVGVPLALPARAR